MIEGIGISRKNYLERRSFLKRLGYLVVAILSAAAIILGIITQVRRSYVVFIDSKSGNLVKARNDTTGLIEH